ncbi:hypothetical protein ACPZ19_10740 [Amycolatopsis lurida]
MAPRPATRRVVRSAGFALAGVLALLLGVGAVQQVTRDTVRDVVLGEGPRLEALRSAFARIDRSLPAPGQVTDSSCPAGTRFSHNAMESYQNQIDVVMRDRLSDPLRAPGFYDFGKSVTADLVSMPLPGYQERDEDSDRVDQAEAEQIRRFLAADTVVVLQLADLRRGQAAADSFFFTPGSVTVEALVVELGSGNVLCSARASARNHTDLEFIASPASDRSDSAQEKIDYDLRGQAATAITSALAARGAGEFFFNV